jgi:hypothetical protein
MGQPYLYKGKADLIIYLIQTKLGIELPDDLIHDIHSNMYQSIIEECGRAREREQYWYNEFCSLQQEGFPINWNEIKIKAKGIKEPAAKFLYNCMLIREKGGSIRNITYRKKELK